MELQLSRDYMYLIEFLLQKRGWRRYGKCIGCDFLADVGGRFQVADYDK